MRDYQTGVITSALATDHPFEAARRVKTLGFDVYQLAWLTKFIRENGGVAKAVDQLKDLNQDGEPKLHSICVSHSMDSDISNWVETVKEYSYLAYMLNVGMVTEHIRAIREENKEVIVAALNDILKQGRHYKVRYALETGNESLDMMVSIAKEAEGIGFCFDPANFLQQGISNEEIFGYLKTLKNYIFQVHIKDAKEGKFVVLGEGDLRLREFLHLLDNIGYKGPLIIEDSRMPVDVRFRDIRESKDVLEKTLWSLR